MIVIYRVTRVEVDPIINGIMELKQRVEVNLKVSARWPTVSLPSIPGDRHESGSLRVTAAKLPGDRRTGSRVPSGAPRVRLTSRHDMPEVTIWGSPLRIYILQRSNIARVKTDGRHHNRIDIRKLWYHCPVHKYQWSFLHSCPGDLNDVACLRAVSWTKTEFVDAIKATR